MKILFLCLFLTMVGQCDSPKTQSNSDNIEANNNMNSNEKTYPFEVLMQGQICDQKEAQIHVIKEPQALSEVFGWINATRSPKLDIPAVDYDKEIVLALFMGEKNYGGYSITVESIEEKNSEIVVMVKESAPSGKFAVAALTQPFCVVKIQKTDKKIRFVKNEN